MLKNGTTVKRVLLLNGSKQFSASEGRLNTTLHETALTFFNKRGIAVKSTKIDDGYDPEAECDKFIWADLVIYQFPSWWMGMPWHVKKYIDEVLQNGFGKLWKIDSETPWGEGGLIPGRLVMASTTWNAPAEAFHDRDNFFHGKSVDELLIQLYSTHRFLGMTTVSTFMVNEVIDNPDVELAISRYRDHLSAELGLNLKS